MARNKTAQGGISLRRKVTTWLAAILLVTMLSTGIATMAGQWTVRSFDIPFDRQQLADFLCVERAAMSVELSKLQKEGLLITKRNHFQLLTR